MSTLLPEDSLVAGLRAGDESAFAQLLNGWSSSMLRLARTFVSSDASAEEVVQDTWLAVIQGIDGFQGRSSLRTWVYRILINTAKRRGLREWRTVPWTSLSPTDEEREPTAEPSCFRGPDDPYPGHWSSSPAAWPSVEGTVLAGEVRQQVLSAQEALPARQRVVLALRDVEGLTSTEVCALLEISAANQRVLLHRARAAVRVALAGYLTGTSATDDPR